jgi:hypothetical protein
LCGEADCTLTSAIRIAVVRSLGCSSAFEKFAAITHIVSLKGQQGADPVCEKDGVRVCLEVKAITKQCSGREGLFFEE